KTLYWYGPREMLPALTVHLQNCSPNTVTIAQTVPPHSSQSFPQVVSQGKNGNTTRKKLQFVLAIQQLFFYYCFSIFFISIFLFNFRAASPLHPSQNQPQL
ncbi:hypothetical protein TorRG33x02_199510, partial [Trema orientale]